MAARRKPVPFVIGLAGAAAFSWGLYHLLLIGSCGGDAPACPPGSGKYFAGVFVGIIVVIFAGIASGGANVLVLTFLAVGLTSIYAALSGEATEPGQETFFWIFGGCFLATALLPVLLIPFARGKARRVQRLLDGGTEAIGTVLEVRDTNVTINNNPRVALRFRIEPVGGGEAFEAEKIVTVSRVAFPRVGDRYPVWFDPADRDRWAFGADVTDAASPKVRRLFALAGRVGTAPPAPAPAAPVSTTAADESPFEKIAKLNALRMAGAITDEEFTAKKDELLKAIV